ncbi:AmpD protein [Oxalobacteraceae bacterium GrIS 1.11]
MRQLSVGQDGWCRNVSRYESSHRDARPSGTEIDLLVIHNVSLPAGRFGGPHVSDLFTGRLDYNADPSFASLRGLKVSAHFLVRRDGQMIQYVSANERAWHAGVSEFQGRQQCNGFSIGIEMEGTDLVAFMPAQYAALARLTAALQQRYRLAEVCGHEHIAPGRKTDPGPCFDWNLYKKILDETLAREATLVLTHRVLRFPSML